MTTDEEKAVAWLHDVLEDTDVTHINLSDSGLSLSVVLAVIRVTKFRDETYDQYLHRVRGRELSRRVKIADVIDNLADDPTPRQIRKCAKALLYLTEDLKTKDGVKR